MSAIEAICDICGRRYSGPACIKCTQISMAVADFGADTIGTPTLHQAARPKITAVATQDGLSALKETTSGTLYKIAKPSCRIGSDGTNHICLNHDSVSKFHALIVCQNDTYFMQDLGGKEGVQVNGEKLVEPVELFDGDHIRLGDFRFYYVGEKS